MEKVMASVVLAFGFLAGCAGTKFVDTREAQEGKSAAAPLLAALADYRHANGKFPKAVDDLRLAPDAEARINAAGLRYLAVNEQSQYIVAFDFPTFPLLTVRCVQGSEVGANKWQCLGK